jgi:plasmid stabilization system protein ParE
MIFSVKVSIFAKADRQNIVKYLSQYSTSAPHKFKQELKKYIDIVGQSPHMFSTVESNPNYRHVVIFGSYVMFYAVDETNKTVLIYRILHGSQDIELIL